MKDVVNAIVLLVVLFLIGCFAKENPFTFVLVLAIFAYYYYSYK